MALDVGAIGKGYAASEALEVLGRLGVRSALVAMSGDLAFSDAPPGHHGWRIAIDSGGRTVEGVPSVLELTHAAVSTSGNSEQHVDIDGRRYSHVIDPSSRMRLVDDIKVTVIARHGIDADGLDTAVSVLGVERGLALIESRPGAAALIVRHTRTGTIVLPSSLFLKLLRDTGQPALPQAALKGCLCSLVSTGPGAGARERIPDRGIPLTVVIDLGRTRRVPVPPIRGCESAHHPSSVFTE